MDETQTPPPVNPAEKILDHIDGFVSVVVQILAGGALPLSAVHQRQLLLAEHSLKGSTAQIRRFMASLEDEDFVPEGMFSGFGGLPLQSEDELRAKEKALLADLLDGQKGPEIVNLPTYSDFGRQLVALDGADALKSLLALSVDDIDGLAKTLKALKAKAAAREVAPEPAASAEPRPADSPEADPPQADPPAADAAAAPTPEA